MTQRLRRLGMAGLVGLMALLAFAPAAGAAPLRQAVDTLNAADQAISGGMVTVAEVNASQDGWIAVHIDEGGKPGPVIGHVAAPKGKSTNLAVKLEQDVKVGSKLWPMLHIDAGTIGTYEFPGPDAPVVVNNNIVMKQITITAAATAPAAALPNTGGEELPLALLAGALAILLAGGLLKLRARA
jgi:LPXTG-motif cell wall-anchored protein